MKNSKEKKQTAVLTFLQMIKCIICYRFKNIRLPKIYDKKEEVQMVEKGTDDTDREEIPKLIWIYWHEQQIPFFIQRIIAHNKKILPGYDFRILNQVTVKDYLPEISFKQKLKIAHKADIIRLELLYQYGGIWLDATVILKENLAWLEELSALQKYDLIAYYRERSTIDRANPVVETWFLASPPKTAFMKAWADEFGKIKDIGYQYYEELRQRADYDIVKQKVERPAYLMLNLAQQIASRAAGMNAYLKKSEDSALFIQEYFGWDNYAINYALTQLKKPLAHLPLTKLTSGDRLLVDMMYKLGALKKKSLLGEIVYGC